MRSSVHGLNLKKKSHVVESSTWPLNSHNYSENYPKTNKNSPLTYELQPKSENCHMLPPTTLTLDLVSLYNAITRSIKNTGTSCLCKTHLIHGCGTISKAFSWSTNMWYNFFFFSKYFSCSCWMMKISPVVDFTNINPLIHFHLHVCPVLFYNTL